MAKKLVIYNCESENLTNLGGPMGTESTSTNWLRPYRDLAAAKAAAEKDYKKECGGKPEEAIVWTYQNGHWSTQDLRFVMYNIRRTAVK
jgi:hypothetical protein